MKSIYQFFCLLAVGCACSGCWPMRFPTSPGVSGVVVDEQTHVPVRSAQVAVSFARFTLTNVPTTSEGWNKIYRMSTTEREEYYRAHTVTPSLSNALAEVSPPIVFTGDNGRFAIPRERRWGLYIVPMDIFPPQGTLVVTKDGYEPLLLHIWAWDTTNLDNISLKAVAK